MKILLAIIGGITLLGLGLNFTGGPNDDQANTKSTATNSQATRLSTTINQAIARQAEPNVAIIDVRTNEEWQTEHVAGSTHWGLVERLEQGQLPPLPKDTEIYIYCRSGNRAGVAIDILKQAGFTNLTNIQGLEDWKAAGGKTETGA